MFDFLVPASIDSASGFDVAVRVSASPQVFPDHEEFVWVRLLWGKTVLAEDLRVPKSQGAVEAAVARLAGKAEPVLLRERERRNRARGYA